MLTSENSNQLKQKIKSKQNKLFYQVLVYLPFFLILSLTIMIYLVYVFSYIRHHFDFKNYTIYTFPFYTTIHENFRSAKGIVLLFFITINFIFLLISLFRTMLMNPGYLPSPEEIETKLIKLSENKDSSAQSMKKSILFEKVNQFRDKITEGPCTKLEKELILDQYRSLHVPKYESEFNKLQNFDISKEMKKKLKLEENLKLKIDTNVPSNHNNNINSLENLEDILQRFSQIDLFNFPLCNVCLRMKFERCHHCRHCNKCVLRLDHHCFWLGNCIGFRNHKYFLLIQFYGLVTSLIVFFTYWEVLFNYKIFDDINVLLFSFYSFVYIVNLGLLVFLIWLINTNLHLLTSGQTVIEYSDKKRLKKDKESIYNLGFIRNFKTIFGNNMLFWLLPFQANYKGLGFIYENNESI